MRNMLEDRVAVITGAGNGIGCVHALAIARQGAKVVVNDIGTFADGIGTYRESASVMRANPIARVDSWISMGPSPVTIGGLIVWRMDFQGFSSTTFGSRKTFSSLSIPTISIHFI